MASFAHAHLSSSGFRVTCAVRPFGLAVALLAISCALTPRMVLAQGRVSGSAANADVTKADADKKDLLARGQSLFDDQQYDASIQTLSAALLQPTKTKAQTLEIYRYLALNYITLNRKDEAESAVRGLLAQDPNYRLSDAESPRFRDFFDAARKRWEDEGSPGYVPTAPAKDDPIVLRHTPPSEQEERVPVELTVRFMDPYLRMTALKIYYRTGSRGAFDEKALDVKQKPAKITLPSSVVRAPLVEYYFAGYAADGTAVAARGDENEPLRIAVSARSKGWILPVAIGGGLLGAAALVGGLALAGVFKSAPVAQQPPPNPPARGTVTIVVGD